MRPSESRKNEKTKDEMDRFAQIFSRLYPRVKTFALQLLKQDDEAEDVAQNVFVRLWQNPDVWQGGGNIDGYVFAMTRNHVLNAIRNRRIARTGYADSQAIRDFVEANMPTTATAADDMHYKDALLLLHLTLDTMPERRRRIFEMSRMDSVPNAEIAQRLNLSVRTVEHQIYLALKELKKKMLVFFFFF